MSRAQWREGQRPAVPPVLPATPPPAWFMAWREAFRGQVAGRKVLA